MRLYRFWLESRSITFPALPSDALLWGARFARWAGEELRGIQELRPLNVQFKLF